MKKAITLALILEFCLCLLCSCKGTSTALTVNGKKIDQAEYAFYLSFCTYALFGDKESYSSEELAAARTAAVERIKSSVVVQQKCAEYGLKLTSEEKDQLAREKKELIKTLGGKKKFKSFLKSVYMTERCFDKLEANDLYYSKLCEYIAAENADKFTEEALRSFYTENYIWLRYVRLASVDEDGNALSETAVAKLMEKGEKILMQAQEGTDFSELILRYSDDRDEKGGLEGVIISTLLAENAEYIALAFELQDGQVGSCMQKDGFYIVLRQAADMSFFEQNTEDVKQAAQQVFFSQALADMCSTAKVKIKGSTAKINMKNISKYIK